MKAPVMNLPMGSSFRFLLVSGLAVGTDFLLAFTLRTFTGLPLSVSAAITFVIVGCSVYFIHEHWTFRREHSQTSTSRLVKNLLVNCIAWVSRIAVIAALERLQEPHGVVMAFLYFGAGAGVSFTINFVANKFWVFSERR